MKDCGTLKDLLPLHAVGETDVEEALRVEEHLASCADCRRDSELYALVRETARGPMRHVPRAPDRPAAPALSPRRQARVWAPRLAAAAVLLAVGLVLGRWSAVPPDKPAPTPEMVTAAAAVTGEIVRHRRLALSVFSPNARRVLERAARAQDE